MTNGTLETPEATMCHRAVLADSAILTILTLAMAKADVAEMTDAAMTDVATIDVTGEIQTKAMTSACEISWKSS